MDTYFFYLDETGDHGLSFIDVNFPLFLLCGCLIRKDCLEETERKIDLFKQRFFKTKNVILHSRDIRKCEGAFQILFNIDIKKQFYEQLNNILSDSPYTLFGSGIDKQKHIKIYGKDANDPYALSLSFLIERVIFYLDRLPGNSKVRIVAEQRGRKEDKALLAHYNSIIDQGTYFLTPERLKEKIEAFNFRNKHENITGLQIADLCAYPMARHILHPKEPYIPFDVIKGKIYKDKKGRYIGRGLKIFP